MAPEQAAGRKDLTTAADVYSLGAILYELLTGRPPFQSESPLDLLAQVMDREPARPRSLNARLPADLETICLKCLEKEPTKRYGSAAALADDLERWQRGEPIQARRVGQLERAWRWGRRNPLVVAVAATLLLGSLTSTFLALWAASNARQARDEKDRADEQTATAIRERDLARRYLRGTRMQLAHRAWQEAEVGRLRELLDEMKPRSDESDLRGFEWHYLDRLAHGGLRTLQSRTNPDIVTALAFSADGKRLASAGGRGAVTVWDVGPGSEVLTLRGSDNGANCVAFSRDGKRLASGSEGYDRDKHAWYGEVRVWDAGTGMELLCLRGHEHRVGGVAFSPDGKLLASAGWDQTVRLWDVATGKEVRELERLGNNINPRVAFSPDGERLAVGGDVPDTVRVYEVVSGQLLHTLPGHNDRTTALAYSPDGRLVARGGDDLTVRLWDAETDQEVRALKGHTRTITGLAFNPLQALLASSSEDGAVRLWDLETGQELLTLRSVGSVSGIAFSPDGHTLAGVGHGLRLWDGSPRPGAADE